jgi:Domain of unknown function (DUF4184)
VPLTFAHPAIVLPLRRWFLFAALACGAMAPDILYFLPVNKVVDRKYGHEFPGLILFSVPAAIILWMLWRWILRDAVIALLPAEEQQKWVSYEQPFDAHSVRAWTLVLIAVAIGIASHIFLDGFAHRDGWGTEHIGFLTSTSVHLAHRDLAVFKLIQYFGSLIGLAVLGLWYLWWSEHVPRDRDWKPQFTPIARIVVIFTILAVSACATYVAARPYGPGELVSQVAAAIIGGTQIAFLGMVVFGVVVRFRRSRAA